MFSLARRHSSQFEPRSSRDKQLVEPMSLDARGIHIEAPAIRRSGDNYFQLQCQVPSPLSLTVISEMLSKFRL